MSICNTKTWLTLLWLATSACNPVTDTQPAPQVELPRQAIQAITQRYPQADDMLFEPLQEKQIWQVRFSQKTVPYLAVIDSQKLLLAYQLVKQSVPDSLAALVRNTVIQGGTFSNLRLQDYSWFKDEANNGLFVFADYDWFGQRYTFRWTITKVKAATSYVTELFPYYQLEYRTSALTDLPAALQESIRKLPGEFSFATVQVDQLGKKQYTIQNKAAAQFLYTDEGVLTYVANDSQMQSLSALTQLPMASQNYIRDTPELAGFGLSGQFARLTKTSYEQLETYQVTLQKGKQTWFMLFNSQGNLLTRTYLNLV